MKTEDVLREFEEAGALLRGHFILTSGRHSDTYLNKSIVSTDPQRTERLCRALAEKIEDAVGKPDIVVSPAMGAIVFGYETARHLGTPFMFMERAEGGFALRRGFALDPGARVAIVEDIISTGLSAGECVAAVRAQGGEPTVLACLIDRSGGTAKIDAPVVALAQLNVPTYDPADLPAHLADIAPVKPGSRGL
ncbi:MAG: orotate phosphoribosyltransferase [Pseudomonadota bacterium]